MGNQPKNIQQTETNESKASDRGHIEQEFNCSHYAAHGMAGLLNNIAQEHNLGSVDDDTLASMAVTLTIAIHDMNKRFQELLTIHLDTIAPHRLDLIKFPQGQAEENGDHLV